MKYAVLVAGGTGGHINAALAVGEALTSEGWTVQYITGKRPLDYKLFKDCHALNIDSQPLRTNNPFKLLKNILLNIKSFISIFRLFLSKRPSLIVGAGGYVCGPTLLVGKFLSIPIFIIEQNAVMGLTNKILGWIADKIFVHFSETKGLSRSLDRKVVVVGNPTRKSIAPVPLKNFDGELKVLVFGGSLGATQINNVIFDVVKKAPVSALSIRHQVGSSQIVPQIESKVNYLAMPYIDDMQKEYEWCDVIISRAGASSVSELAIIKKPVLIFPYPAATDNHQLYNAQIFKAESDFTVEIAEPGLTHDEYLRRTQEFLVKASRQELKYTQKVSAGNHTCDDILREIKTYVGMA